MTALHALLDAGARFDCEHGGGLTDHRPMVLTALAGLGADDARLAAVAAALERDLDPAPPPAPWPRGDAWTGRLGDRAAWPAYRSLFAEWLAHDGPDAVLEQTLPALMPGVAAAAFHGPIRTAGAVAASHLGELGDALAYWACRHQPLAAEAPREPRLPRGLRPAGPAAAEGPPPTLDAAMARLDAAVQRPPARGLILDRIASVAAQPAFGRETARLAVDADTLAELTVRAARLHAASGNFTALHLVTGCHAVHLLAPFLDDAPTAIGHLQRAWLAAWLASGVAPGAGLPDPHDLPGWPSLLAAARAHADEHAIKLAWSAADLARRLPDGDTAFRASAARALAVAA
jgi:hypothetical protein